MTPAAPAACTAALLAAALFAAGAAHAVPGGDLGVLPKGPYVCELPGDAGDPGIAGGRHQPESDFEVIGDSAYRSGGKRGIYLLTGDRLVMTTGPLEGRRFRRIGPSFVRQLAADGSDGELRCIRSLQTLGLATRDGKPRRCKREAASEAGEPGKPGKSGERPVALGAGAAPATC